MILQKNKLLCPGFCFFLLCFVLGGAGAQPQGPPPSWTTPADTLLFREGELLLSKGDSERALWRFKQLITDHPQSSLYNEARFQMGVCYTQLKRPKDAIRVLNELFSTFLGPTRMVQVFTLLGDNYLEMKDPFGALVSYGKGLFVPNQPEEELKKKIRSVIDGFDSEENLREAESLFRGAYAGGYAKLKLAQQVKQRGDDTLARKMIAEVERDYRNADYLVRLKEREESHSPPSPTGIYRLGVILPLSGIYQSFGERVLQGIQLAVKEVERPGRPPLISLVVRDSKGDALTAEQCVIDLALREKVVAMVGPLLSSTVERAARKAEELQIPLITFSQKDVSFEGNYFVFQNSLTPAAQVETLATFAVKELELRKFAIFYPNSPYGLHFKNLFTQAIAQREAKVVGSVIYQEDQTDFRQEITFFFKIRPVPSTDPVSKKEPDFVSGHAVDAVFIPDTHHRVALLLSQMAYYNLKGVTFLGPNGWNHPGLLSEAEKAAEGAVLVDTFSLLHPSAKVELFANRFRKAYARDPETLEALGYESAELVRGVLTPDGESSSLKVRDDLRRIWDADGVAGLKKFDERGQAVRTLSILRVHKGKIEYFAP